MRNIAAASRSQLCAIACVVAVAALAGCTYYQVAPAPAPGPSVFDRSWNAAQGALADTGVRITTSDRGSGTIYGTNGSEAVTMSVLTQADGSVRVETNVRGPNGTDAALAQKIAAAYNRRMGR